MAAESVGQIGLDLVVNQNGFDRQMQGIGGLAKKAGIALAGAFAVKQIIDFGKQCLDLGSDLQEVQNVVDTTFPSMSGQVNEFATNAITSFGLSETMAKKFTGTFGAMAKSFGFSEESAYSMATALTGLSGDVASFYNISQDEAYTKLKSVFSGETETLKDLGIVMTQSALDSYAMANGFGKTTAKMSEAEKVALRFQFVQEKLALAQGDFSKTSGSWANQTRVLKLQFDSLKASIGQGLIVALTPAIKVLNALMTKLVQVAGTFKSFIQGITGTTDQDTSGMADNLSTAVDGATELSGGLDNTADSAKKAAKEIKGLMGFDEINKLGDSSDVDDTSSATPTIAPSLDLKKTDAEANKTSTIFDGLINKTKELANTFKTGFGEGLGSDFSSSLERTKEHLSSIGSNLKEIFTDSDVQDAANRLINKLVYNLGREIGAFASIGQSITENIVGGFDIYLDGAKGKIKGWLVRMMDIRGEISDIYGNFSVAIADIFEVLRSDVAKHITSDIIEVFSSTFMGSTEIFYKIGRDILDCITRPIIENKDAIKVALEQTLKPVQEVTGAIADFVGNLWDKINKVYDEKVSPSINKIKETLTSVFGNMLELWNTRIAPLLDELSKRFASLMSEHITPLTDKLADLFGKIAEYIGIMWHEYLGPFIEWFQSTIVPILIPIVDAIGTGFINLVAIVADVIGGIITSLTGWIDFFTGIFTGDLDKAMEGVKEIFQGLFEVVSGIQDGIKRGLQDTVDKAGKYIEDVKNAIQEGISRAVDGVYGKIQQLKGMFNELIYNIATSFADGWNNAWSRVVDIFSNIWNSLKNVAKHPLNAIIDMINKAINGINNISNIDLPGIGNIGVSIPEIPHLAQGGYVRANTPQLAMIGDNTREGEIVAPESKIAEAVAIGISSVLGNNKNVSSNDRPIELTIKIGETTIGKLAIDGINALTKMNGSSGLII